ncbi:MAG: LTA synthase family protein [Chlorobiaceae bacterium]|nr:LTA synthase family protein [Chlorobiaceae bacterium]
MSKTLRYIVFYVSGILLILPFWIFGTFGSGITIEQMLFHLLSGAEGMAGTDIGLKKSFVLNNLVWPLAFPAIVATTDLLIAKFAGLRLKSGAGKALNIFCTLFFIVSALTFVYKVNLYQYVRSRLGKDTFSGIYADPKQIRFRTPQHKKNLILIYVESLEDKLLDLGPTHINAIGPIEDLPGYRVPNFIQAPGTGWSIAGMISSQSSIPLKPFYKSDVGNYARNGYFPNLSSLGDILAKQGYAQYFLVGPDLHFSGMDQFYLSHGYNVAIGRDEWRKRGLDQSLFTGWGEGLHDDTLLDESYKFIQFCRSQKQPFAITIMTTDTHFPDGFPSPRCPKDEAAEGFVGAFRYTSRYLSGFINRLIAEGILKNTDIVIMGDHLFMSSSEQEESFFDYSENRHVYFKVISSDNRRPNRDIMTHFDVAPTILDLLGMLRSSDTWFGLGISLFSRIPASAYERHLKQVTSEEILSPSVVYDRFWSTR